ncbi:hypothetical protein [Clostridium butyricum]|uniref:hypothetical protein n=1 Tax=Clostridium butyricum TaxID=1492 RepID=UPI0009037209|nr:hypothetical protein [Clostridium butyricum]APF22295.1 hypothetical protein NPD4_2059 [Clostridium butyricum]
MASILSVTIDQTQNVPILLGGTNTFIIKIQNLSSIIRLYNMNIIINTPDGITVSSASQTVTSTVSNSNGSKVYSWINLKDLAPLEVVYSFTVTIKAGTKFSNGNTIPFGYIFNGFTVQCQMDTMPRGSYDIGNEQITSSISMTFSATRYNCTIATAGKVLKGAGSSLQSTDYSQTATAICNFTNNSISQTLINASILLPDGIRYIGNISTSGTDSGQFTTPTISSVTINGLQYTQLFFGAINLSISSNTKVIFTYAVWNQYNNNTGNLIYHGTNFSFVVNAYTSTDSVTNSASFTAMDLIISNSMSKSSIDVTQTQTFSYVFSVGGYYDIENIIVNYLIPDGISYSSSSVTPSSVIDDPTREGFYLTYNFASANRNSSKTVTINGIISAYYRYQTDTQGNALPVAAYDSFISSDNISGILIGPLNTVSDNAFANCNISIATITKAFVKGYYEDGTPKSINSLAPGDLAEYKLTYNASTLNAIQKSIYLDDFFPLSADPVTSLQYNYTGYEPSSLTPMLISPHGVDFNYGDIPGKQLVTIDFKVPIASLGGSGQNNNLFKLKGTNNNGYSYSSRTQVTINIGTPNLSLSKTASGPNTSAIKSGETYIYSITIKNSSNLGTETDAFNFTLTDNLSSWFTIIPQSITTLGTGLCETPVLNASTITMNIDKLSPGQYITLSYSVTIINTLAPGVTITTNATNTEPYSQYNDLNSFQYTNQIKTASTSINSQSISLTKVNNTGLFKIGSPIVYTITMTVPQGTIAYGLYVKDVLPNELQSYISGATRNGISINPVVSNNTVTFPNEGIVDARVNSQTIIYSINCKIINGTKSVNGTTITETNNYQCIYKQTSSGNNITINKNLNVTINVPNISLVLSATDATASTTFTSTGSISTNSVLNYKLSFTNNSSINLINGVISIPVDSNLSFKSINTSVLCSGNYVGSNKTILVNIPLLNPGGQGFITFTLIPLSNSPSGTTVTTQATAIQYYNDIWNKIYSGETSNSITLNFPPSLSLLPNPADKIDDSTSFRVSTPGSNINILNYFQNTGGGYDSFTTQVAKVGLPCTLYIDNIKIADIPANTAFSADLQTMANLAPNTLKTISIISTLPNEIPLGFRYDFIITCISKSSPYPQKTVTNIDPK